MHKVEVIDSLGPVQMRIELTSPLANHLHDQSHVATQVTPSPTRKPSQTYPKGKKHAFAVVQLALKRMVFFLQNCAFATCLVAFPLGSDVVVRKLFVPLVDSSLLKINPSIPLLPQITCRKR